MVPSLMCDRRQPARRSRKGIAEEVLALQSRKVPRPQALRFLGASVKVAS